MDEIQLKSNPEVASTFNNYPDLVRDKMFALRELIIETANEIEGLSKLEETLKWGEPSYLTKNGSTLRVDWKQRSPDQYAMYFQCTSKLVPTFKMIFGNVLKFEGNRAIILEVEEDLPTEELKQCIKATLTYHKVKHLQTLGI